MMLSAREFYYYLYYTLYRVDPFGHSRGVNEWRAYVGVTFLQLFIVLIIDLWMLILSGQSPFLGLPKLVIVVACLALAALNYRALIYAGRWQVYARRFEQYSPAERRIRTIIAVLFIVLVILLFGVTLFELASRAGSTRQMHS